MDGVHSVSSGVASLNGTSSNEDVLNLFGSVFESYGFDMGRYKASFIKRRLDRRMGILNIVNYEEYAGFVKKDKREFDEIFTSLSINVTNFFRDYSVYDCFKTCVIPKILEGLEKSEKIKVWSAGCASGEEPYSIAVMFLQAMEKLGKFVVEVTANDINKAAVEYAKNGTYPAGAVEKLPRDTISKYFEVLDTGDDLHYTVKPEIKEFVSFRTSDILSNDAKRMDAVFCRNVLIYYEREAQELIINKFYNSLKNSGFLVLGMDETMLGRRCEKLFLPVMPRERIYQKVSPATGLSNKT